MKRWLWAVIVLVLLGSGIFAWQRQQQPSATIQRAVVVDGSGNLNVVGLDGSHTILTTEASDGLQYLQPTPAPNSKQIVYIAAQLSRTRLIVQNLDGTQPKVVFESADLRPFYLYWSPDSKYVAFLASDSTMHLMLVPADGSEAAFEVREGQPSYFAWTTDSQQLLLHTGGVAPRGSHALYDLATRKLTVLAERAGDFQAPAWNNDASARYVVMTDGTYNRLVRVAGDERRELSERTPDSLVFVLSPDRKQIAYMTSNSRTRSALMIADDVTGKHYALPIDAPIAFFWSPDSRNIAALMLEARPRGPSGDAGVVPVQHTALTLHWEVISVADSAIARSPTFNPSETFITLLPFFDQYAASLQFWSNDNQHLIYGTNDGVQTWNIITNEIRTISQGTHGVWVDE